MTNGPSYFDALADLMRDRGKMHESAIARELEVVFKNAGKNVPENFARAISSALQSFSEDARQYEVRGSQGHFFRMHGDGYWSFVAPTDDDLLA